MVLFDITMEGDGSVPWHSIAFKFSWNQLSVTLMSFSVLPVMLKPVEFPVKVL